MRISWGSMRAEMLGVQRLKRCSNACGQLKGGDGTTSWGSLQLRLFARAAALSGLSPPISWEFPAKGQADHVKVLNVADNPP